MSGLRNKNYVIVPAVRELVLRCMLSFGTEKISVMGVTLVREYEQGKLCKTSRIVGQCGEGTLKQLQLLEYNGSVSKSTGRGRHAGWYLTEQGVKEAKLLLEAKPTAVTKPRARTRI